MKLTPMILLSSPFFAIFSLNILEGCGKTPATIITRHIKPTPQTFGPSDLPTSGKSESVLESSSVGASSGTSLPLTCEKLGKPPEKSSEINPNLASFLGNGGTIDGLNSVDIGKDCSVILGGSLAASISNAIILPDATTGLIARIHPLSKTLISAVRIGQKVLDLEVARESGAIAAATDTGIALLDAEGQKIIWQQNLASMQRIAIGTDGTVAALAEKTVKLIDPTGKDLGSIAVSASTVNDVAIRSEEKLIYVTGFKQDDGAPCTQLQIAFIRAYDYTGKLIWNAYDWNKSEAGQAGLCADSRGIRLSIGRDGMLYFAAESAGGNSIFSKDPKNIAKAAPNAKGDSYQDPFNTSSNHITYIGRYSPKTGEQLGGSFLLARLPTTKGNTIRPKAITADEQGRISVGGVSASAIAARENIIIGGQKAGTYAGGDGFLATFSPDFATRLTWVVWHGEGANSEIRGIASGSSIMAMASVVTKGNMIAIAPLFEKPATLPAGYFSIWPGW